MCSLTVKGVIRSRPIWVWRQWSQPESGMTAIRGSDGQDIVSSQPDVILLPDEPFAFDENNARQIAADYRASTNRDIPVFLVEGSLITWPGTRIARAVVELAPEFTKLTNGLGGATL